MFRGFQRPYEWLLVALLIIKACLILPYQNKPISLWILNKFYCYLSLSIIFAISCYRGNGRYVTTKKCLNLLGFGWTCDRIDLNKHVMYILYWCCTLCHYDPIKFRWKFHHNLIVIYFFIISRCQCIWQNVRYYICGRI